MAWKADNVRTVLFPVGQPPEVLDVWKLLGVGEPDQYQRRVGVTGIGQASGGGVLLLVQAGRVELRMQNVDPEEGPQLIEDPSAQLKTVYELTLKLLEELMVTRLACAADLVEPQDTAAEAAGRVASALPGLKLPAGASDVVFQLNVKRYFSSGAVEMNRVCKWGTATQQLMHVEITPTGGQAPVLLRQREVVTLGLDINTAPQSTAIPRVMAKLLLDELYAETTKLLKDGISVLLR
jgi:hypothetical protein